MVYQSFQELNESTQTHDLPFLSSLLKLTLSTAIIAFFYVKRHTVPISMFDAFIPYPLGFRVSAPNTIQPPFRPVYLGLLLAFATVALRHVALTAFYEALF